MLTCHVYFRVEWADSVAADPATGRFTVVDGASDSFFAGGGLQGQSHLGPCKNR